MSHLGKALFLDESGQRESVDRVNPNELQGRREVTFRSASCLGRVDVQ